MTKKIVENFACYADFLKKKERNANLRKINMNAFMGYSRRTNNKLCPHKQLEHLFVCLLLET